MTERVNDPRRQVPRTDAVLAAPDVAAAIGRLGRAEVKAVIAAAQERVRRGDLEPGALVEEVLATLPETASTLRPVVNATGIVVHTNLGRAPLSAAAREALAAAAGTTDVEFDLATGTRGRRGQGALGALADAVPAAGDVHVVTNNAAALLLAAVALAPGREIVLSRGELVEIGDGFRIPELLESAGARIREVGTTNRTALSDYRAAVGPETGFVLKVHPSNFTVTGFTSGVPVAELATAGLGVPLVADIGSGLLAPHPRLPDEPDADRTLRDGADLVTASGDKLLGGPQAGLMLGEAGLVRRLRRHPTARALRVDKLTLAALEATLRGPEPPVAVSLDATEEDLAVRVRGLVAILDRDGIDAADTRCESAVGGGGAPEVRLASRAVSLPSSYAAPLRTGRVPVVGRIHGDRLLLDLRTVPAGEDDRVAAAVREVAARCTS